MDEGHERLRVVELGRRPRRDEADGGERLLDRGVERRADALEVRGPRGAREAADADRDRVDRPAAQRRDQLVADPLDREALLDDLAVVGGHGERGRVAEEVRGMEQVHVERVALDPLAAVQEPPEGADRRVDRDPVQVLEGVDRRHLVRDRADAADAGDDVDDLVAGAPDDQPLEVARRLEDLQPGLDDLAAADPEAQRAFALDPGDVADLELPLGAGRVHDQRAAVIAVHHRLLPGSPAPAGVLPGGPPYSSMTARNGLDQAVNPANSRLTSSPSRPPDCERAPEARRVRLLLRAVAAVAASPEPRAQRPAAAPGDRPEARDPLGDHHAHDAAALAREAHGLVADLRPAAHGHRHQHLAQLVRADGAAVELGVDLDVLRDRRGRRERLDVLGMRVDGGTERVVVGPVAERLDPAVAWRTSRS